MPLVPLHLGALHPVEQVLTILLAFGPFVVLGIVITLRRRADDRAEAAQSEQSGQAEPAEAEPQRER